MSSGSKILFWRNSSRGWPLATSITRPRTSIETEYAQSVPGSKASGTRASRVKEAVPALIDALGDPREGANARVAEALADHGPAVVPDLIRGLKRREAGGRAG